MNGPVGPGVQREALRLLGSVEYLTANSVLAFCPVCRGRLVLRFVGLHRVDLRCFGPDASAHRCREAVVCAALWPGDWPDSTIAQELLEATAAQSGLEAALAAAHDTIDVLTYWLDYLRPSDQRT